MMESTLNAVARQRELIERYGIQARNELTGDQVKELIVEFFALSERLERVLEVQGRAEAQVAELTRQRDHANGKLSALQRKYNKLEVG